MTPGERLNFLVTLRDAVLAHPQSFRLLSAYGLAQSDWEWGDSNQPYDDWILDQLEGGSVPALLELAEFLSVKRPIPQAFQQADTPWKTDGFHLFASHQSADKVVVAQLKSALSEFGIETFVAHEDIEVSKQWLRVVEAGLQTCEGLVACIGTQFHSSTWTDQEVGWVVGRRVPVVSWCLDACDPYGFLGQYQALKPRGKALEGVASDLVDAFLKSTAADRVGNSIVRSLATSTNWADAKKRVRYLQRLPQLSPPQVQDLETALESNFELRNAFGVPETIQAAIQKSRAG